MTNDEPDGRLAMTAAGVLPNHDDVADGRVAVAEADAADSCCDADVVAPHPPAPAASMAVVVSIDHCGCRRWP